MKSVFGDGDAAVADSVEHVCAVEVLLWQPPSDACVYVVP